MSALFNETAWLIPVSVFVGGLIGSPHCFAMCGPIALNFAVDRTRLIAYHGGRMLAYTTAGAAVGALGKATLGSKSPPLLANATLVFLAVLLIYTGFRALTGRALHLQLPKQLTALSARLWRVLPLSQLPPRLSSLLAGLLSVFLPCGHLYSFLIGAVATGSALKGALFMFAFWLGSAPILIAGAPLFQYAFKARGKNGQRWAGALLIIAGLSSVVAFGANVRNTDELSQAHDTHQPRPNEPQCPDMRSHP